MPEIPTCAGKVWKEPVNTNVYMEVGNILDLEIPIVLENDETGSSYTVTTCPLVVTTLKLDTSIGDPDDAPAFVSVKTSTGNLLLFTPTETTDIGTYTFAVLQEVQTVSSNTYAQIQRNITLTVTANTTNTVEEEVEEEAVTDPSFEGGLQN